MSDLELDRMYQKMIDSGEYCLGLTDDKGRVVMKFQLPDTPQELRTSIAMLRNQVEDDPGVIGDDGNPHLVTSVALVPKGYS